MIGQQTGRNDPCPCGSGKKYKKCCLRKDEELQYRRSQIEQSDLPGKLEHIHKLVQRVVQYESSKGAEADTYIKKMAGDLNRFNAAMDDIRAAVEVLDAHRGVLEGGANDPINLVYRSQQLFESPEFAPYRFTPDEIQAAFDVVGYPPVDIDPENRRHVEEFEVLTAAAIDEIVTDERRIYLASQLLMLLPQYVEAEQYVDGWLILMDAFDIVQAPEEDILFLDAMLRQGMIDWADQVESEREEFMRRLGLDPDTIAGMELDEIDDLVQARLADPETAEWIDAFIEEHPTMQAEAEAMLATLERRSFTLFERDDTDFLLLTPDELASWVPALAERLEALQGKLEAAGVDPDAEQMPPHYVEELRHIFFDLVNEMADSIFTPERRDHVINELKQFRNEAADRGDDDAIDDATAAIAVVDSDQPPSENAFLVGMCSYSLKELLRPETGAEAGDAADVSVGDSVVVKPGVEDPDFGYDLGGWQGRVTEIMSGEEDNPLICVAWDSVTLRNMPPESIDESEEQGLSWSTFYIYPEDIEPADPRDTPADVAEAVTELGLQHRWSFLGEEGRQINEVLAGVPSDEMSELSAWDDHLAQRLSFPFEAEVDEYQEGGPIRSGDRLRVTGIEGVDDSYGIIVDVKKGRHSYAFPLCDLEVVDTSSPNHDLVHLYRVWFANR